MKNWVRQHKVCIHLCHKVILFLCFILTIVENCITGWGDTLWRWRSHSVEGTWRHTFCGCSDVLCSATHTTMWSTKFSYPTPSWSSILRRGRYRGGAGVPQCLLHVPKPISGVHQDGSRHCDYRMPPSTAALVVRAVCDCAVEHHP
jgi:hypothetical protein